VNALVDGEPVSQVDKNAGRIECLGDLYLVELLVPKAGALPEIAQKLYHLSTSSRIDAILDSRDWLFGRFHAGPD
jgi:hypothetical protein